MAKTQTVVHSTAENQYPIQGSMVLFQVLGETYIGGFSENPIPKKLTGWFAGEGYLELEEVGHEDEVIWCALPDLYSVYKGDSK